MGSGASTPRSNAFAGCDEALLARAQELAPKMPDDERVEKLNSMLKEFNDEAEAFDVPEAADETFDVLKTTKDGSAIKLTMFPNKNKAKKQFNKVKRKGRSAVLVKDGTVDPKFICGNKATVTFMIGVSFGMAKCDLSVLDEAGSPYQIFVDDGVDDDDADEDDEVDDVDANFVLWKLTKDGSGIKGLEFKKKKKAVKKFNKMVNKKRPCILVEDGNLITHFTVFDSGLLNRIVIFIIGCAFGKGVSKSLGPVEDDDSPLGCLEDE